MSEKDLGSWLLELSPSNPIVPDDAQNLVRQSLLLWSACGRDVPERSSAQRTSRRKVGGVRP